MPREYKLNKKIENDFDFIAGAGLIIHMRPDGYFVENHFGENVTEQQRISLRSREYYLSPDEFRREIKTRKIPEKEQLKGLSRKELESKINEIDNQRARIKDSIINLSVIGGYLDTATLRIMQEGYRLADESLEQESFAYLNAIAFGGGNDKSH